MEETLIFPSPNWFQTTGLAVSSDGWVIFGGPSKSLCVLKPSASESKDISYQAHVVYRAYGEKIVSVDISPEWPEKRNVLVGSKDGMVKQWLISEVNAVQIKYIQSHDVHQNENEEVIGAGYCNSTLAVTVGSFGSIVKWDISSNIVKTFNSFLKSFKPTCLACSPHLLLNVAVGTKQGVVLVLDLNGSGKILYKVRGQNDEVVNISWCPQYEVLLKKSLNVSEKKSYLANRLNKIRQEGIDNINTSGTSKNLPEDSFDESIVQEDDTFDIYKDHAADEFGHKKYQPEEVLVKIKEEKEPDSDFLAECLKLKEDLLKIKNEEEKSIESLVNSLEKTHVDNELSQCKSSNGTAENNNSDVTTVEKVEETSSHIHKHLLVTVGKNGSLRIWSKSGKLVANGAVPTCSNKNLKTKSTVWATVLWYRPDLILIADGKSQLLECNPLKIDSTNKLQWKVVHTLHKRGLSCIATNAPRVQNMELSHSTEVTSQSHTISDYKTKKEDWVVWTVSQDRSLVCYSVEKGEMIATYNSCGGYVYTVEACPYDARQYAVSVGDGAVRVLEMDTAEDDETKLTRGTVVSYWQNVQGKVLTVAWHPTKENLLAFATAESRVGLIDTSGKAERPAKTLQPSLQGGIYSLSWGPENQLYACGGGEVAVYNSDKINNVPKSMSVIWEKNKWALCVFKCFPRGVVAGSVEGAVAVLDGVTLQPVAAAFVFSKMIHTIEWHPQQTSESNELSKYRDLIAVSSVDKQNNIVILEYGNTGDVPSLNTWKSLSGHKAPILRVAWNPHRDEYLLSTSQDSTVRVWDVSTGTCVSIFGGHAHWSTSAAWSAFPAAGLTVLSGGADSCLRMWNMQQYPAELYQEVKHELARKEKKKKKTEETQGTAQVAQENVAIVSENVFKTQKKFLMPLVSKQMYPSTPDKIRKLAEIHLNMSQLSDDNETGTEYDFLKMFGNTNDVKAILDLELQHHLENDRLEAWIMLSIFRGEMSAVVQFASERDLLCPFLVTLAPCVSFKYWKDTMQLYLSQIDRMVAKGDADKLNSNKEYGGATFRRAVLLLSLHDVKGAIEVLTESKQFKEAYILARTRHMESTAEETLRAWADYSFKSGMFAMACLCYVALGDPYQAAMNLSKIHDEESLKLAIDLALVAGQSTLAQHLDDKLRVLRESCEAEVKLDPLPSRVELLTEAELKDITSEMKAFDISDNLDEEVSNV